MIAGETTSPSWSSKRGYGHVVAKPLLTVALHYEQDVVVARQRARQVAGLVGFDAQDQTRIATAVSEIARNAFRYARRRQGRIPSRRRECAATAAGERAR